MKKTYVKPELSFESFELSASIASGCSVKTYHGVDSCSLIPGVVVFSSEYNGCEFIPEENGYCYQTLEDASKIFDS